MKNKPIVLFEYTHDNQIYTIDLAPIHESDAERLMKIGNDKEIAKNVGDTFPHPYTMEDAQYRIRIGSKGENTRKYGIYIDGIYTGDLGREQQKTGRCAHNIHFGYWLGREYWGKGIITNIVQQVIPYIFSTMPEAHRIYATVFGWNHRSKRVLEKSGMQLEAYRKEFIQYEGSRHDQYEYAILRSSRN